MRIESEGKEEGGILIGSVTLYSRHHSTFASMADISNVFSQSLRYGMKDVV